MVLFIEGLLSNLLKHRVRSQAWDVILEKEKVVRKQADLKKLKVVGTAQRLASYAQSEIGKLSPKVYN